MAGQAAASAAGQKLKLRVRVLAWTHIVFGGIGATLDLLFIAAVAISRDPAYLDIITGLGWILGGASIVYFIPSFMAGVGLLKGWTWARGLVWAESALLVMMAPFGTALAGLALWALLTSQPQEVRPGEEMFLRFEQALRRAILPIVVALIAIATLGVMLGLGYIFRDYIAPEPKQVLTPLPSGVPAPVPERPTFSFPEPAR